MLKTVKTIAIVNPRVIDLVYGERPQIGRSMTEAAENLILEAIEQRKIARAKEVESVPPTAGTLSKIARKSQSKSSQRIKVAHALPAVN